MRTTKTDQTGRMPRLILVFAGRTCQFVRFVIRPFRYYKSFKNDRLQHVMWQTACLVVKPVMVDLCFPLKLHDGGSCLKLNGVLFLNLFQSEVGLIVVQVVVFVYSDPTRIENIFVIKIHQNSG